MFDYDEGCQLTPWERYMRDKDIESENARRKELERRRAPLGTRTGIYLRREQLSRIDERCAALGLTRSQYLVQATKEEIEKNVVRMDGRAGTRRRTGSGRQVCLFLDAAILERIDELAHARGASRSQVAAELLEQALALGHNSFDRNPS